MSLSRALCQFGRSKSIVLGSYVYILGPMSTGKVTEYDTGFQCIYPGPYASLEGPRV